MPRFPKLDPGQLLGGLVFSAAGLLIIGLAALAGEEFLDGPRWLGAVIGASFLLTGLLTLQVHTLWADRFPTVDWHRLWGGSLAALVGLTIVAFSLVDDDASFYAPRFVVTLAGASFLLAGVLVFRGRLYSDSVLDSLLLALFLTCFGGVVTGLFFDPGESRGESSLDTPFGQFSLPLGGCCGSLVFVPGGLILNGLALYAWVQVLKNLIKRSHQKP